uniref:Uncharacterized protein n=1 Tax=Globisporangium ultimum (strain ATCC 200006 / CBS 805.95 / DAOM BR144) TaxID=431595 RepID=K3X3Y5_GLOUD
MEAIHHDAHLEQKENVEAHVGSAQQNKLHFSGGASKSLMTPKRPFRIHSDSKSTGKKGLKNSASKTRRVLGDISNQHRNLGDGPDDNNAAKKKGLGGVTKRSHGLKTPIAKRTVLAQIKLTPTATPKPVEEVEEIEHAYGGLSSPQPDASYFASLREEMINDIIHNKAPSLIDDYEPAEAFGGWDNEDERKLLESGTPPSKWWSQSPTGDASDDNNTLWNDADGGLSPLPEDIPAPDDFADAPFEETDNDLLDDILSVDIEAACQ